MPGGRQRLRARTRARAPAMGRRAAAGTPRRRGRGPPGRGPATPSRAAPPTPSPPPGARSARVWRAARTRDAEHTDDRDRAPAPPPTARRSAGSRPPTSGWCPRRRRGGSARRCGSRPRRSDIVGRRPPPGPGQARASGGAPTTAARMPARTRAAAAKTSAGRASVTGARRVVSTPARSGPFVSEAPGGRDPGAQLCTGPARSPMTSTLTRVRCCCPRPTTSATEDPRDRVVAERALPQRRV